MLGLGLAGLYLTIAAALSGLPPQTVAVTIAVLAGLCLCLGCGKLLDQVYGLYARTSWAIFLATFYT